MCKACRAEMSGLYEIKPNGVSRDLTDSECGDDTLITSIANDTFPDVDH
jgi:hypothetical protein